MVELGVIVPGTLVTAMVLVSSVDGIGGVMVMVPAAALPPVRAV